MTDRKGQTWRFGDKDTGYILLVVETVSLGHHRCCVLEAIGGWASMYAPSELIDQFELRAWEDDAGWERVA